MAGSEEEGQGPECRAGWGVRVGAGWGGAGCPRPFSLQQPHARGGPQEQGCRVPVGLRDVCQCLIQATLQALPSLGRVVHVGGDSGP